MSLTITDLFCGAGGSSSGAVTAGVTVRIAANHWDLAVQTHNTNHPTADHDCADISQVNPRRYPRTDILWASPECTNHSQAKGKKRNADSTPDLFGDTLPNAAAERSRATMWDVPRFAEVHRYRAIIVENVIDAAKWVLWPAWRLALDSLGYCLHPTFLNSMHAQHLGAPAPQSRDRMYIVAHQRGIPCPDLPRWTRPRAYCPTCDEVIDAVQAWKNGRQWGRYRQQYLWRCPNIACRNSTVEPAFLPAAAAIDWTMPGQRIGDRAKPLAAKTVARIEAGLRKYARPIHLEAGGNQYDSLDPKHPQYGGPGYVRAWPADDSALRTLHTQMTKGVAYAPGMLVPVEGRDGKTVQPTDEPLRTQTARNETGLAVPPYVVELRGGSSDTREVTDPLATVTAAGNHHALLVPYYGNATSATSSDEPVGTLTTRDRYAMVMRNNTGGAEMVTPASEELRTVTTAGHQSLLQAAIPDVEDCLFRMFEPHEIQAGMAFDRGYDVLGNKREKVRQLGNAVCPPNARDLIGCVSEMLGGAA